MQLPESYWNDVNRYTGEILAGLPVSLGENAIMTREASVYAWPAQEDGVDGALHKQTYQILGLFAVRYYHLGLSRTEFDTRMSHFIRFDPARNVIVRVQDDNFPTTHERTIAEDARSLWERRKMAKRLGILLPTDEDYTLLHDELRRGAQFRAFEV